VRFERRPQLPDQESVSPVATQVRTYVWYARSKSWCPAQQVWR
jgi:hypothetical protein